MTKNAISLLELNSQIKDVLQSSFPGAVWVRAEIAELRENRNGHCYLDLIEKDEKSDQIVARVKAMIWSYTYRMLKPYFETSTGRALSVGIKVMVQGNLEYQEVYGLSFVIRDIDPTYTLGDLEQRRREVLNRLEQEGVIKMNKELPLPLIAQRIAVISSPSAAGYEDFIHQLKSNQYGIRFYHKLFPAIMQGDQAPQSITAAFDKVFEHSHLFDVVVLIRGGGASVDLLCFDDYWIAYHITQFPLPIITGIGHERDISVADLVAHTSMKTPTAVAEFLVSGANQLLEQVDEYAWHLQQMARSRLSIQKQKLDRLTYTFTPGVTAMLVEKKHQLKRYAEILPQKAKKYISEQNERIRTSLSKLSIWPERLISQNMRELEGFQDVFSKKSRLLIKREKEHLSFVETRNRLNDPAEVLKRGYTLTFINGEVVKDSAKLSPDDVITTRFRDGMATSRIIPKKT